MVRKLMVIMVFMALNTGALANAQMVGGDSLTYPWKKVVTLDTLVGKYRKLAIVCQECFVMVEKGMKSDGVIGYIRNHQDVFLPMITFLVLYMFWLRRRARQ
jgi:hypothetical protein